MTKAKQLGPADLEAFMRANQIPGKILQLEAPTPTVDAAAQAVLTLPERIVKSILFMINGKPLLAISCGVWRVEQRAIAVHMEVGRKRVKLASPQTVLAETGFEVGAMPPFGHRYPLPSLIDKRVLEQPSVYAGGGAENALVHLSPEDILRVTHAEVIDLIDPSSGLMEKGDT
jgi:prolyl-tRNA editing enzyme YbaK/EbsC (Cys-tRNA(Pro) deacylase)